MYAGVSSHEIYAILAVSNRYFLIKRANDGNPHGIPFFAVDAPGKKFS